MITDKPRVYRKTLIRYKKLAQLLLECVTKIVRMLQAESLLSSEDTEFQELASDFDVEQIDMLRDSVDNLGNLIDKKPSAESSRVASDTVKTYKQIFHQASGHDFGYLEVNECAELLDNWIFYRFSGTNPNFRFQVKQIPIWATFIIIAYGRSHSLGQSRLFAENFKTWCKDITQDTSNCWALPYEIFNMTKHIDPHNFTLDAMVIYDILINGCLYQLIDGKNKIPMDSSYIANLLKDYRPDLAAEVRTRFTREQELIERVSLCATNFAEADEA